MHLKGQNIVITGGTSGIGYELVRQLHEENRLLVIARNSARLERLAKSFPGVLVCQADLSQPVEIEAAAQNVLRQMDRLDLLINNAAVQYSPMLLDASFDRATIQEEIAVNLTTPCFLTALLLPALQHDREAAIVNVNSSLALMPKTTSAVYCATKAAMNVFSQSLRYQLEATNIRVLQAFMPLVDTPMTQGRGSGKISVSSAVDAMLSGIRRNIEDHDIGKVRILRHLIRFAPAFARRIMKAA